MSMDEWPDNRLDELFRKSAEEYDVPFNANDWPDLSRRLDQHEQETWFERISRWSGFAALLLLLLGGLSWLVCSPDEAKRPVLPSTRFNAATPTPKRPAGSRRVAPSSEPDRTAQRKANQPMNAARPGASQPSAFVGRSANVKEDNRLAADRPTAAVVGHDVPSTPQPTGQPTTPFPAAPSATASLPTRDKPANVTERTEKQTSWRQRTPRQVADRLAVPVAQVADVPTALDASGNVAADVPATQPVDDARWLLVLSPIAALSSVVQSATAIYKEEVQTPAVDVPVRRPQPRLSRFSVLVFASPDLSAIGLKNFDRPGSNYGVSVQYHLTDRLSLNTGAMLSTKIYKTGAGDYVWPAYYKWDVWPVGVEGKCTMIDVPLNLRYDWLLRPRGDGRQPARWFASAGVTSYFIRHEVYTYDYEIPDDPRIVYRGWDNELAGRPGGSFRFSNINLSVGYERPISRRLSWQVEPFLKVPLKQVGYFKVRLLSTGAFAGLRYRF